MRSVILAVVVAFLAAAAAAAQTVVVSTDREFRLALANDAVDTIHVAASFALVDTNWPPSSAPLVVSRSVLVASLPGTPMHLWPTMNFAGLPGRVLLQRGNVTLQFVRLAVTGLRPGVLIAVAPGINLFAISVSPSGLMLCCT